MTTHTTPRREEEFAADLGARLRSLRETAGLRQADIAHRANEAGLPWARSSVALLESGTRNLSAFEWLLLPHIYRADTEFILRGINTEPGPAAGGPSDLDRKLAARLSVSPELVAATAQRLWGQPAAAERDERAGSGGSRSAQTARGHVTRLLVQELAAAIPPAASSGSGGSRAHDGGNQ